MVENKSLDNVVQLKNKRDEKIEAVFDGFSETERELAQKTDDFESVIRIGEAVIKEMHELEKRMRDGSARMVFVELVNSWKEMIKVFSKYHEIS